MKHILFATLILQNIIALAQSPPMVWTNDDRSERNEYVYFRRDVTLSEKPTTATINLYADSRYALYVNKVYVGFGPARTFHKHPTYDIYDIAAYLKKGKNTIAVKVLSNGMVTYQLFDYNGGFTAWGEIKDGKRVIDLNIKKDWFLRKSEGYDQSAGRLSFATGAIEVLDTRKDYGWNGINAATTAWQKPTVLKNQKQWGKLTPRIIPHLTQKEIAAVELMGAYTLDTTENIYSFRIPVTDKNSDDYGIRYKALAYTYIYSPDNKEVTAGLWWGDYYLNGEPVFENKNQEANRFRKNYKLKLNKGWNLFMTRQLVIWGTWEYYMALPKGEGIVISSTKKENSKDIFQTYGPFEDLTESASIDKLDMIQSVKTIKKQLNNKWEEQCRTKAANHPARDLVWNRVDLSSPVVVGKGLSNMLKIPGHQKGTALIYDMGEIQLGRIFVEGDFPEGTVIDIGFSEEKD